MRWWGTGCIVLGGGEGKGRGRGSGDGESGGSVGSPCLVDGRRLMKQGVGGDDEG